MTEPENTARLAPWGSPPTPSADGSMNHTGQSVTSSEFDGLLSFVEWVTRNEDIPQSGAWDGLVDPLKMLLDGAAEFSGAVTVGDALRTDLSHLAATIGIASDLDSVAISDLTTGYRIADAVCDRLSAMLASVTPGARLVLDRRLFGDNPMSLAAIGSQVGVTGEAVRRTERRIRESLSETVGRDIVTIAVFVADRLGRVVSSVEFKNMITGVFDDDASTAEAVDLARRMLKSELNYSCIGGICLDQTAVALVERLRGSADEISDDVGLIDEEILRDHLPSDEWVEFFPQLLERCGFTRIGGRLALRDTGRARAKAALLEIGRVATKEEIAEILGSSPSRVSSQLSVIPSVARADKRRWGLAEWIDDEYDGISGEIVQRINEDGGAVPLKRLVEELPRLFGVSESSVRAYADAPQFAVRDGYVSLADESTITLRSLDDVIDGRDASGNPYWTFTVDDRYLDGYSVAGFPPELASALGCAPNSGIRVRVDHPVGCRDLSVNWRLTSISGASLGYLSESLRLLGVKDGDRIRLVIKGPGVTELHDDSKVDSPDIHETTSAESLLERMKSRRTVL